MKDQKLLINVSIVAILALMLALGIWKLSAGEDTNPCSKNRYPGRCYEVERDVCTAQWDSSEKDCRSSVKSLNLPPARLTGPIMDKCMQSKYDRVFRYLRKQTPDCQNEFQQLEDWRRTNPDF